MKKITYEDAIEILGVANKDLIFNMVDDIKEKKIGKKSLLVIDEIIQNGKDIQQFIKDIINHFRNLMIIKSSKNPKNILEIDDMERYIKQSESMDLSYILKALEILTEAETQGKWSTQTRIILEMAVIKMVNIEETLSLEERIKRLEEGFVPRKQADNKSQTLQNQVKQKPYIKEEKNKKKSQFIKKKKNTKTSRNNR